MQKVFEGHETASRLADLPRLGVRSSDQRLPFQTSASVPARVEPTAMHIWRAGQDTPSEPSYGRTLPGLTVG
jgi:hypothetical protein